MVDDALKDLYRRRDIAGMDQTFGFAQGGRRGRDGFRHLSSYLSFVVASHPATWSLRGQKNVGRTPRRCPADRESLV